MRKISVIVVVSLLALGGQLYAAMTVSECVEIALQRQLYTTTSCTTAGARAKSPGLSGGTVRAEGTACIEAAGRYAIIGAPAVRRLSCNEERCGHDLRLHKNDDGRTVRACITARAWSESKSFGAGGWSSYEMCAEVEEAVPTDIVLEIMKKCEMSIQGDDAG